MFRDSLFIKIIIGTISFLGMSFIAGWITLMLFTQGGDVVIPDILGRDLTSGLQLLQEKKLYAVLEREEHHAVAPKGYIVGQNPLPGEMRKSYSTVKLVLSSGPERLTAPDLRGFGIRQARIETSQKGFGAVSELYIHHATHLEGEVVSHIPAPGEITFPGNPFTFLVSLGPYPEMYRMPDLVGKRLDDVQKNISDFFQCETTTVERNDLQSGIIVSQDPEGGRPVLKNSRIRLEITKEKSAETKSPALFTYRIPMGFLDKQLLIYLIQNDERTTLLERIVKPLEEIKLFVPKTGNGTIEVLLDNQTVLTETW